MKRCLIAPYGFLGDILFASSIPRKLKEERQYDVVDMVVGIPQIVPFLKLNPWIDSVWVTTTPTTFPGQFVGTTPNGYYHAIFFLKEVTKEIPPPMQFQLECGVQSPDTKFEVWTNPEIDAKVKECYPYPYIAVLEPSSWEEKAFLFSREEYERAVNVPYYGYGGKLRNIHWIVEELQKEFRLLYVGMPKSIKTLQATNDVYKLLWDVSVLKHAQCFIGAEGGMANFAAGVGTKTVLTSDYVWQLYGPKGILKQLPEPKLGPRYCFPEAGHIDLDPFLTDEEVLQSYQRILREIMSYASTV